MARLVRFGVAMERALLRRFDKLSGERGYDSRSEALRDLVRRAIDIEAWESGKETVATVTLVYDHHVRELTERLTEIQHAHGAQIISTLHVHLDHDHCMEVIAARGPAGSIRRMADELIGTKGVVSGDVSAAALPGAKKKRAAHKH